MAKIWIFDFADNGSDQLNFLRNHLGIYLYNINEAFWLKQDFLDVCSETLLNKYGDNVVNDATKKRKDNDDTILKAIRKPSIPVAALSTSELEKYFPKFISDVYKIHDLKVINKWALPPKDGRDEVIPPRPSCPWWNNGIMDCNSLDQENHSNLKI